ncbi:MAG: hypothetical protein HY974_00625, partial [Candidatus Kerfeldbacteria bacterium]|nr:hypothetical protein [Candidatus Kerfeldbacteria bacterium]
PIITSVGEIRYTEQLLEEFEVIRQTLLSPRLQETAPIQDEIPTEKIAKISEEKNQSSLYSKIIHWMGDGFYSDDFVKDYFRGQVKESVSFSFNLPAFKSPSRKSGAFIFALLVVLGIGIFTQQSRIKFLISNYQEKFQPTKNNSEILGAQSKMKIGGNISFRLPVTFKEQTTLKDDLQVDGKGVFKGDLTAPNVLYGIKAGNHITISDQASQIPTIAVDLGDTVSSIQGQKGEVNFLAGTDITIDGLTINDKSTLETVLSRGHCSSCLTDADIANNLTIEQGGKIAAEAIKTGILKTTVGGTGLTGFTAGDLLFANSSDALKSLPIGTQNGQIIQVTNGAPAWSAIPLNSTGTSNLTSGANLVGVYDNLNNSTATNVQQALKDLDTAITSAGVTPFATDTDATYGNYIRPTVTTDHFVLGGDGTPDGSTLFFNSATANLALGTNNIGLGGMNGKLTLFSSGSNIADVTLTTNANGDFLVPNGNIGVGTSLIDLDADAHPFKLEVAGSIGPNQDGIYDLGSPTKQYRNLYLTGQTTSGGNITISNSSPSISFIDTDAGQDQYGILVNGSIFSITNNTTGATALAISSNGNVDLAGGSGATGCTIADASGNLNCSGNLTLSGLTTNGVVYATGGVLGSEAQLSTIRGGTGIDGSSAANGNILIGNGSGFTLGTLTGTLNQVSITNVAGSITLSTPQDIATTSTPTFAAQNLTSATNQLTLGAAGNTTIISAAVQTAPRTLTIPALTGADTFVFTNGPETLSNKTIGSTGLIFSGAATDITTAANENLTLTASGIGEIVLGSATQIGTLLGTPANATALCRDDVTHEIVQCPANATNTSLQLAYNTGNTITTSDARNIAFTLASGLATSTSFSLTNAGTANAFILNDTNAATNNSLVIQSGGVTALTINENGNLSTTGNLATTGTGTITSAGTLTAANGLTLTTGNLDLTATSGSLNLTSLGNSSINTGINNLLITSSNFNATATGINGTAIGTTTPSTGNFTNLGATGTVNFPTANFTNTTNQFVLGSTNTTTISALAPSTSRVATLPALTNNDTFIFANETQTLTNKTLTDATLFQNTTDTTKKFIFDGSNITTGTTQTITIPDASGALCLTTGNCAGSGGVVGGNGLQNRIAKFTSTGSNIGDSNLSDSGSLITALSGLSIGDQAGTDTLSLLRNSDATSGTTIQNSNLLTLQGAYWTGTASNNVGFSLQNRVTNNSPPGYQLSFQDNLGTEIASLTSTGNLQLTGALAGATGITSSGTITLSGLTNTGPIYTTAGGILASENFLNVSRGGTGVNGSTAANGNILIGNGYGYSLASITGTANQINVANGVGSITLSLPQDIAASSSPTFAALTLTGLTDLTTGTNQDLTLAPNGTGQIILSSIAKLNSLPTAPAAATTLCRDDVTHEIVQCPANSSGVSLQLAYQAGNTINAADAFGNIAFTLAAGSSRQLTLTNAGTGNSALVINDTNAANQNAFEIQSNGTQTLAINENGNITTNGALTFNGVATDITTGANENLTLTPNGTGQIVLGTTTQLATLPAPSANPVKTLCRDSVTQQIIECSSNASGVSLQLAYDAGNTITTTDGKNIDFTLTSGLATSTSFNLTNAGTNNAFVINDTNAATNNSFVIQSGGVTALTINENGNLSTTGTLNTSNNTASTNSSTGALVVTGGVGIGGALNLGSTLGVNGLASFNNGASINNGLNNNNGGITNAGAIAGATTISSGAITSTGTLTLRGVLNDITTGTNEDLTLAPNGTGSIILNNVTQIPNLSGTVGATVVCRNSTNEFSICSSNALNVTLQQAYNSGNTIATTDGKNIDFTLASGLTTSTSFTLNNAGTANAFIINDTNAATNNSLVIQSAGVNKLTINEDGNLSTAGTLTSQATSNQIVLGNNNTTTISSVAPGASRFATIPALTNDDTFIFANQNQTLSNKTIGSTGLIFSGASTDITTGTNEDLTLVADGTGQIILNDTTQISGPATFTNNIFQTGAGTFSTGTGNVSLNGTTSVTGTNPFTVGTGLTSLGGQLGVTSYATFSASLNVLGATTLNSTLTTNGASTFNNNISQTGTGTFSTGTGNVSLNGATSITGTNTFAVGTGATTLGGTLGVTGNTTLTTLTTSGLATLNSLAVTNNTTLGGTLGVTGIATFNNNIAQTGAGTFSTGTGNISLNGATAVTGANPFTVGTGLTTLGGQLGVSSYATFSASLDVIGGTSLASTLGVTGQTNLNGGASINNGLNNNNGGITNTGNINGAGTISSGAITTTGTLTFNGVGTDITTGTNENLALAPNGTGQIILNNVTQIPNLSGTVGATVVCRNSTNEFSICSSNALNVTLQQAYNSGNTIATTDGRNIDFTLASGLTTSTSLSLTNAGTANAFVINDTNAATNTSFVIQSAGVNALTINENGNLATSGTLSTTNNTASTNSSTGALVVTGGTGIGGALNVGGVANIIGATSLSTLSTSGLATIDSLSVTNNAGIGGTLGVTGATTLSSTLGVTGIATFNNNITQIGIGTFSTGTGNVSLNGATSVTGTNTFTVGTGVTTLGGTLGVAGLSTFNGGATIASSQAFTANGPTTFSPNGTNGITFNTSATNLLTLNGIQNGAGSTSALCTDSSKNLVYCNSAPFGLQAVYNAGNTINTTDARNIDFTLASGLATSTSFNLTNAGTNNAFIINDTNAATNNSLVIQSGGVTALTINENGNLSTTGTLATTGTGTITSAGTLTASNGLTQTTGALNLTAISGTINATGLSGITFGAGGNNILFTSNNFNTTATGINATAIGATTPSTAAFTTLSSSGATDLGTAGNVTIGNATGTFALTSTGLNITNAGALTGVTSLDTIATSANALTFAADGSITSTGANALTLDSGTTGTINLGTGNNAKTINIGTGNAGNTINIGASLDTVAVLGAVTANNLSANNVALSGGAINGTTVGATIRASGAFTTLDTNSTVTLQNLIVDVGTALCLDGSKHVIECSIGSGTGTLQSSYDNGNTILTTTGRNLDFTLAGGLATSTSFNLTNAGTATAFVINDTNAGVGTMLDIQSGGASTLKISEAGVLALAGDNAADITTLTSGTGITIKPASSTTAPTGGSINLTGGSTTAGTSTGGSININAGTGTSAHGAINIGTLTSGNTINIGTDNTVADTINIGSSLDAVTIAGSVTANNLSANNVAISGGAIEGTTLGATTRSSAAFTTLAANSTVTFSGLTTVTGNTVCLDASNHIVLCNVGSSSGTLQSSYDNGNTILTTTGRNLDFTLGSGLATSTSFALTNAGTAEAFIINDTNAAPNQVALDVQSGGVSKLTIDENGKLSSSANLQTSANIQTIGTGTIISANGLTVSTGGAVINGGLNNNSGGITNAGSIAGASTINASGTIAGNILNATTGIQANGTQIVDALGNLSNIPTISSGAITTTGTLTLNGVATDITTGTNEDLTLTANGSGLVVLNDTVRIPILGATGSTVLCRNTTNQLADCDPASFGVTLQRAYDTGNTITTSNGRDIAFTLNSGLSTPTSFSINNQGTAPTAILDDTNLTTTNTALSIRSNGTQNLSIDENGTLSTNGSITTTGSGSITSANGLTVSSGGASIKGGLNLNNNGLTSTGAIVGATNITASGTTKSDTLTAISQLVLGSTNTLTIATPALATPTTATIPVLSGNDTFVFANQTQTLTNKTLTDTTTLFQNGTDTTKKLAFDLSPLTSATTRTLSVPDQSGTIAVAASAPIALDATSGTISCPTCLTTATGNFVSSLNGLVNGVTIAGGGINNVSIAGQTITVTGTEADTMQSVTTRGATSDKALTLSNSSPLTLSTINPTLTFGAADSNGVLSIKDSAVSPHTLLSLTDNGTTGTLAVNTVNASNIGAFNATGNISGSGAQTISGFSTINNATITSGSLTGGSVSGGSLTGGTYAATGATVTGGFTLTQGDGNTFNISDGLNNIFTVSDAGTVGNLSNIGAINATGTITLSNLATDGVVTVAGGVLSSEANLAIARGGTGLGTAPISGQILIGNASGGYSLATLATSGSGISVTNGNGSITLTNTGVTSLIGTTNQINVSGSTGAVTLSLPQSIATTSTPTFASQTLSSATNQLVLGTTNTTTINSVAPTLSRIATIPALSGNDTFAFINQTQTLTNKTLTDNSTLFQDDADNTKKLAFQLSTIGTGTTRTLTVPNASGTLAVQATAPINLDATSGTVSCPTCLTTATGNFVSSINGLQNDVNIAGAGINTVSVAGQTITVTGTEADTLQSVTTRGASSDQALTLSNASPLTLSTINPTLTFGAADSNGVLSIKDTAAIPNTLLTLTDNGTTGTLAVNTVNASNIGAFNATGNITGSGTNTLSNFSTINGAAITGGTLSGGSISGGSVSGGSLTGGTYSATGATVTGGFTTTIGDGTTFNVSDGLNNLFTVSDAGTVGNLSNIGNITASGSLTLSAFNTGGVVINNASGVLSSEAQLAIARGGTGTATAPNSGQLLIGNSTGGYNVANLTQGSGITITNGSGSITLANSGVLSAAGTANQVLVNGGTTTQTGNITLSLPQSIATTSTPSFTGETLSGLTNQLVFGTTTTTTINSVAPTLSRIATIPALSGNDTFVFANQAQTLTNKTLNDASTKIVSNANANTLAFNLNNLTANHALTAPNNDGTIAVAAATPLALDATTGTVSCPTCLTTATGNFVSSINGLQNDVTVAGGGINTVSVAGQTITVTGTEADTLQSVTTRGASSDQALALSNASPLTLSNLNPVVTLATAGNNGTLTIKDAEAIPNTLLTLQDLGTAGKLTVNTIAATNIGGHTLTGNITGSGSPTLSGFGTINSATITGGSLSGGTFSGGSVSGGSLTGGTYTSTGASVTGGFTVTQGNGSSFNISDGTNNLFTVSDAGTVGNLSNIGAITASGSLTLSALNTAGVIVNDGTGVLSSQAQLSPNKGGTGIDGSLASNGQLLIGNGAGYSLSTLTPSTGIGITNGNGSITIANTGV